MSWIGNDFCVKSARRRSRCAWSPPRHRSIEVMPMAVSNGGRCDASGSAEGRTAGLSGGGRDEASPASALSTFPYSYSVFSWFRLIPSIPSYTINSSINNSYLIIVFQTDRYSPTGGDHRWALAPVAWYTMLDSNSQCSDLYSLCGYYSTLPQICQGS